MNVFIDKIGHAFAKVGLLIKDIAVWLPAKLAKLGRILEAEKAVEPELKTVLTLVIADVASFASIAAEAINDKGLNWTEDKVAVAAAEKLINDLPALLKAVEDAAKALEAA